MTAYHQDPNAPAITNLTVRASFDAGATWTDARVTRANGGAYNATFTVPTLSHTNGYVTLRATATDTGGNSVDQTLYDTYGLTDGS